MNDPRKSMTITITTTEAKALLAFASTDKARLNLYGVSVSNLAVLAATDGHTATIRLPGRESDAYEKPEWSILIPRDKFERVVKIASASKSLVAITIPGFDHRTVDSERYVTLATAGVEPERIGVGPVPPPMHHVVPITGNFGEPSACFHPWYLARVADLSDAVHSADLAQCETPKERKEVKTAYHMPVAFASFCVGLGPLFVEVSGRSRSTARWIALIMPMRGDHPLERVAADAAKARFEREAEITARRATKGSGATSKPANVSPIRPSTSK